MQLALEDRLFILLSRRRSHHMSRNAEHKWDSLCVLVACAHQDPNTIFYVMPFHTLWNACDVHDVVARDRIDAEMAYA